MSVVDGNPVNAAYTNTRLMSKQLDNDILGYISTAKYLATLKGDVATAASINSLNTTSGFKKLTGSTNTDLNGLASGTDGKWVTVYNGSSAIVTVRNEAAGATAADRILTPGGNDIVMAPGMMLDFRYDITAARWICGVHNPGIQKARSATIANNQTGANASGVTIDSAFYTSAIITAEVHRTTDAPSDIMSIYTLSLYFQGSSWNLIQNSVGDDAEVTFGVTTSLGVAQLTYDSSNMGGGSYVGTMKYKTEYIEVLP